MRIKLGFPYNKSHKNCPIAETFTKIQCNIFVTQTFRHLYVITHEESPVINTRRQ